MKSFYILTPGATTTITVPSTNGSSLAKLIRAKLKDTGPKGTSVKVLEMPGPTVIQSLVRNNPFPRKSCSRTNCPLDKCNDNCSKESIVYKATCRRCEAKGNNDLPTYVGKTSRTIFIRANQHREDCQKVIRLEPQQLVQEPTLKKPDCSSWMVDHHRKEHKDD